ncbi:prepilin-type N-terminal cleavage/methylation domain-containing protein [Myxococcota bacterium]|nr:prepilin-type N-terminal cleavage/methylation domain-containing protein [Myxococcota bacterium]
MSNLNRKAQQGFTLIELMIVVAIIGILAAIAIPNFLRFQLKSKSSEGKVNIAAIRTAEESYLAEFGSYVAAVAHPAAGIPGASKQPLGVVAPGANFDQLGWGPEGNVFFQYAVRTNAVGAPNAYTITAEADIDVDTVIQGWGYYKPDPAGVLIAPVAATCAATGVWNADPANTGANLTSTVGPCAANFGQSVF